MKQVTRSRIVRQLTQTFVQWQQDNCLEMGAAIAYYALFSLFPLILIILSIFGLLVGPNQYAYDRILYLAGANLPPDAYEVVETTLKTTLIQFNESSAQAGIISFMLLLITASGFFSALTRAFDRIWGIQPGENEDNNWRDAVMTFLRRRFFSFFLVLSAALLMFVSLISEIIIRVLIRLLEDVSNQIQFIELDSVLLLRLLQFSFSFSILTLVMIVLFKFLPSTRIAWRDVRLGGVVTALLFMGLQYLISNSIVSIGSRFQSYGVAGSVMVLLLWIYFTSQIFFWGGEFTYVYSQLYGSRKSSRPKPPPQQDAAPKDSSRF